MKRLKIILSAGLFLFGSGTLVLGQSNRTDADYDPALESQTESVRPQPVDTQQDADFTGEEIPATERRSVKASIPADAGGVLPPAQVKPTPARPGYEAVVDESAIEQREALPRPVKVEDPAPDVSDEVAPVRKINSPRPGFTPVVEEDDQ
jgi:hypothetical protein